MYSVNKTKPPFISCRTMMMTKVLAKTTVTMDTKYLRRIIHDRTTHPGVCAVLENLLQYFTQELSSKNNLQKEDVKSHARPETRFLAKDEQQGSCDIRHLTTFQLVRAKFLRAAANQTHTRQGKVGSASFRRPGCLVQQASSDEIKKPTVSRQRVKNLTAIFSAEEKSDTSPHTGAKQNRPRPLARRSVLAAIEKFETLGSVQSVDCRNARKNKATDPNVLISEKGEQINDKRQGPKGKCQASDKSGMVQSPTAPGENVSLKSPGTQEEKLVTVNGPINQGEKRPTTQEEKLATVHGQINQGEKRPSTQGETLGTVQGPTTQGKQLATVQKPPNQGEMSALQSLTENVDEKQSEQQSLKNFDYGQEITEALQTALNLKDVIQQEQVLGELRASEGSGKEVKEKSSGSGAHISPQLTVQEEKWANVEEGNFCEVIQWNFTEPFSHLCFTVEPQKVQQVAVGSYPQVWCLSTSESPSTTQFRQGSHHAINQSSWSDYLDTKSPEIIVDNDIQLVTKGLHDGAKSHDLTKSFKDHSEQSQPSDSGVKCTRLHGLRVLTGSKKLTNCQSDSVCARPDIPFHFDTEDLLHDSKFKSKDSVSQKNLNYNSDSVEKSNNPQPQPENDYIPVSDDPSPFQSVFHSEKQNSETDLTTSVVTIQLCRQQHITDQSHDISSAHTTDATSHGQDVCNNKPAIDNTNNSETLLTITSMGNEAQQVNKDTTLRQKTESDLESESLTKNPLLNEQHGRSQVQPSRPKYRSFQCEEPCVKKKYIPKTIRFTDTF